MSRETGVRILSHLLLLLLPAEGRPLFYWGARPPVIVAGSGPEGSAEEWVSEVHAALDGGALVVRLTFDRPVREALYLPDGSPVSGRLRAVLYVDADDDRATGLAAGPRDLRTGADQRLEVGVLTVGEDLEEKRSASALVTVALAALTPEGRRRTLWRGDDAATPANVSIHGEWLELRVPEEPALKAGARIILAVGDRSWDGRVYLFNPPTR